MNTETRNGSYRYSFSNCLFFCIFLPLLFLGMYVSLSSKANGLYYTASDAFVFISAPQKLMLSLFLMCVFFSRLSTFVRFFGICCLAVNSFFIGFMFFSIFKDGYSALSPLAFAIPLLACLFMLLLLCRGFEYSKHSSESFRDYFSRECVMFGVDFVVCALFCCVVYSL